MSILAYFRCTISVSLSSTFCNRRIALSGVRAYRIRNITSTRKRNGYNGITNDDYTFSDHFFDSSRNSSVYELLNKKSNRKMKRRNYIYLHGFTRKNHFPSFDLFVRFWRSPSFLKSSSVSCSTCLLQKTNKKDCYLMYKVDPLSSISTDKL